MRLFYLDSTGDVLYAVLDKDLFTFKETTEGSMSTFDIDELAQNQSDCLDLLATQGKKDNIGRSKYYVDTNTLYERENWVPFVSPPPPPV